MKLSLLFLFFFLVGSFNAKSQTIHGQVVDDKHTPVPFAQIEDTISKKKLFTNVNGQFKMETTQSSVVLKITHQEFEGQYFKVDKHNLKPSQTITFTLDQRVQLIEEVYAQSNRVKRIVDQQATNIIDYLPFSNLTMVLKSKKMKRFLSLEGTDTTYMEFPLDKKRIRSIYEDCFGNIHLLSKDSAYQIHIDSSLRYISTIPLEQFSKVIQPCVASLQEGNVFESFSHHNRKYTLTYIDYLLKNRNHFFSIYDQVGESVAASNYAEILYLYHKLSPPQSNVIRLNVWTGRLIELDIHHEINRRITWYSKIRAVELEASTFKKGNELLVFDQFSDSIHLFHESNLTSQSSSYNFQDGGSERRILKDRKNEQFYELVLKNGIYSLYPIELNTQKNDEETTKETILYEVPFANNVKVFNNWLYFLAKENDYYDLRRIALN